MDHTITTISQQFSQYGLLLGAFLGLICGLYLHKRYLRKMDLGLGIIRVLAVMSCIITGAVLSVVAGSVLAEGYAWCQDSGPIAMKSSPSLY